MDYYRPQNIADKLGISLSSVWRWTRENKLPKPRKISHGVTVWRKEEVDAAIEKLFNENQA